jgi:ATP-dependent RNA helicase DeaD
MHRRPSACTVTHVQAPIGFDGFGLDDALLEALKRSGFEEPTPIQRQAIPPMLEGRDLLGLAGTGTGKTAAFGLPMVQRLQPGTAGPNAAGALVLVPTRELALQVSEALTGWGKSRHLGVLAVYGGTDIAPQIRRLKRGVDVVVATPGRALDHVRRRSLSLARIQMVVLDEADEMLDMGFAEDLETLLAEVPKQRQTALFSATMPPRLGVIAEKYLREPVRVRIAKEMAAAGQAPRVRQQIFVVPPRLKEAALARVLALESPTSAIIFCRTREDVDTLTATLNARGFKSEALHGGLSQDQRDRVMRRFKGQQITLLVATDVAARGLDIDRLSHVVNYELPSTPDVYIHRTGRTGRIGREGVALTFMDSRDYRRLPMFERAAAQKIELAQVPTVEQVRTHRLELLRDQLRTAVEGGGLERFRKALAPLTREFDPLEVAAAGMKLAHNATSEAAVDEEAEIPPFVPGKTKVRPAAQAGRGHDERRPTRAAPAVRPTTRAPRPAGEAPARRSFGATPAAAARPRPAVAAARPVLGAEQTRMLTLLVGVGKKAGIRPADLVGAIVNEAGVPSKSIGTIEVGETSSRVQVIDQVAGKVMTALRATTLRGRKPTVKRFRE